MGKKRIKGKVIEAVVDTSDFDRMIESLLGDGPKKVLDRMKEETQQLVNEAKSDWPVKTGKSRDALRIESTVTPKGVEVNVINDVDYVYYIKALDLAGKNPWRELVVKASKKLEKELAEELGEELLKLAGK